MALLLPHQQGPAKLDLFCLLHLGSQIELLTICDPRCNKIKLRFSLCFSANPDHQSGSIRQQCPLPGIDGLSLGWFCKNSKKNPKFWDRRLSHPTVEDLRTPPIVGTPLRGTKVDSFFFTPKNMVLVCISRISEMENHRSVQGAYTRGAGMASIPASQPLGRPLT